MDYQPGQGKGQPGHEGQEGQPAQPQTHFSFGITNQDTQDKKNNQHKKDNHKHIFFFWITNQPKEKDNHKHISFFWITNQDKEKDNHRHIFSFDYQSGHAGQEGQPQTHFFF